MKLINISYSANTRQSDLAINLKLLLTPWAWNKGNYSKKITKEFELNFPNSKAYTFNYARSGMYILFKSLNRAQPQNEIIVQGFTCIAAVNPIIWAGLKPIYSDINKETCNLDIESVKKTLTPNVKAIMFQHTFGNSNGIEEIKKLCKEKNLLLIEDCANTIYGKHKNKLIGSFGDVAIFSFGRDKAVTGVNGGVVVINNENLLENFEKEYMALSFPSIKWTFQQLVFQPIWYVVKSTYDIGLGKLMHLLSTKLKLLTRATSNLEKMGLITKDIPKLLPNSLAMLAYMQLKDIKDFNEHRIKINKIYEKEVPTEKQLNTIEGNILLRFPLIISDKNNVIESLLTNNLMQIGDWYDKPITPSLVGLDELGYNEGSCPNSEYMAAKLINLPNHININESDASNILKALKDKNAI